MKNLYWKVPIANLDEILAMGEKKSNYPHENIHYSVKGNFATVQGNYSDEDISFLSKYNNITFYEKYENGFLRSRKEFESYKGINIPWLSYTTRGKIKHDGYGNGFHDYYFNDIGANDDLKKQLDILKNGKVKYIRLWLNIYHSFNTDKETVGYTGYKNNFLVNVAAYCDWCFERDIELIICLDDCWYTFPWHWLRTDKEASYIQACKDAVSYLKNKPAIWGWDYCNEPYMGWDWRDDNTTIHKHKGIQNDLGYTRTKLTDFFTTLFTELKAISPRAFFSVGDSKPTDNSKWNIENATDFYQCHWYGDNVDKFNFSASQYGETMVIIGEYGYSPFPHATHTDFNIGLRQKMLNAGFPLIMLWSMSQVLSKDNIESEYIPHEALNQI